MTLANTPTLWLLLPIGVVLALLVTIEIAVGVTVSTLPRSRFQHKWTPSERRRVTRIFLRVLCIWPSAVGVVCANLFLPTLFYIPIDVVGLGLMVYGVVLLVKNGQRKRRILEGHCIECDYNLRGRPDATACPECGVDLEGHPGIAKLRRANAPTEK